MSKAAGMDQIHVKFFKEAADVLAYTWSKVTNLSAELSVFPEECKVAKRKPLLKKDSFYMLQ